MKVKYPEIEVELDLIGPAANAFCILAKVDAALRKGGVNGEERKQFDTEAKSGDYDNLLQTCMKWVDVT